MQTNENGWRLYRWELSWLGHMNSTSFKISPPHPHPPDTLGWTKFGETKTKPLGFISGFVKDLGFLVHFFFTLQGIKCYANCLILTVLVSRFQFPWLGFSVLSFNFENTDRTSPYFLAWSPLIRSATDGSVYLRENWCRSSILIKVRVTNWISEISAFSQQFVCILGDEMLPFLKWNSNLVDLYLYLWLNTRACWLGGLGGLIAVVLTK